MSDVTPSQVVSQVTAADPKGDMPHESAEQKEREEKDRSEDDRAPDRRVEDIALILGVPASDVTPEIQKGLSNVMNEFDRQRHELEFLRKRVSFLEKRCDTHPFLPVMSRHALERTLTKVLNRADQSHTENSFVCFQLEGLESVRHTKGLSVADLIISNVANLIKVELRASDVIGSMGGYGLGVVFTVTSHQSAEEKVERIVSSVEAKLHPTSADIRLAYGIHPLRAHETVGNIFAAADEDLRRRLR